MGRVDVTVQLSNLNGTETREVEAMVDTGAAYSFIPASMLRELGIVPTRTMGFRLANGQEIDYEVGRVVLRINGYAEITSMCYGQDGNAPLIGVVT